MRGRLVRNEACRSPVSGCEWADQGYPPVPGEQWAEQRDRAWSASLGGYQPRSAVGRLPEVLPDAVMVQSAECMFDPTLLVALPGIGQNTADPYRQEILAPSAVLVADGGDRIICCGDLH